MQSTICSDLHNKVTNSSPKRCNWDCKWEHIRNAFENALKNQLKGANGCKIWLIKTWNMSKSANGKAIHAFEVLLMIQFRVQLIIHLELHLKVNFNIYIYKDAQESAPDVTQKGILLDALELDLFMQLSMHKSMQNDSKF